MSRSFGAVRAARGPDVQAIADRRISLLSLEQRWKFLAEWTQLGSLSVQQLIALAAGKGTA